MTKGYVLSEVAMKTVYVFVGLIAHNRLGVRTRLPPKR